VADLGASNAEVIAEFRAHAGKISGFFENDRLLLLTTTGRKSGKAYTTPLSYLEDGGELVVIGANLASSRLSDWYLNILANSDVTVEVGDKRLRAQAQIVNGQRRDRIVERVRAAWDASREQHPDLRELPVREDGTIPVVALEITDSAEGHISRLRR
jgi:deazaflavin-dependent oxidoreductase (nitroreductase family)